jgi:hypothetical protein
MSDKDKIILICATGRSGSTTLQRIINTIPGSNICGENYGAINSLLEFYIKLYTTSKSYVPGNFTPFTYEYIVHKNIKPSWYNSYQLPIIEQNIRNTITDMFKKDVNTKLWGFKEIRYENKKINFLKYFKHLFPQTKVIIQIRENIAAQSQSSWHKNNKDAIPYLKQNNKDLWDFYNQNKDWCYFTTFERMFDKNNLQNIFSFIDCRENYNETAIENILKNNLKD